MRENEGAIALEVALQVVECDCEEPSYGPYQAQSFEVRGETYTFYVSVCSKCEKIADLTRQPEEIED